MKRLLKSHELVQQTPATTHNPTPKPASAAARILQLQSQIGNQAVLQMLRADMRYNASPPLPRTANLVAILEPIKQAQGRAASAGTAASTVTPAPIPLQRKPLAIGSVRDPLEAQADALADKVMRMPEPVTAAPPGAPETSTPVLQRKCACGGSTKDGQECEQCKRKSEALLQKKSSNSAPARSHAPPNVYAPPIVHEVLRSPGRPLDPQTTAFFQPRLGADLSHVRLHTDSHAAESAKAVHARAYTVGSHIALPSAQYSTTTDEGRRILAHELAHVVQQTGGNTQSAAPQATTTTPILQRQPAPGLADTGTIEASIEDFILAKQNASKGPLRFSDVERDFDLLLTIDNPLGRPSKDVLRHVMGDPDQWAPLMAAAIGPGKTAAVQRYLKAQMSGLSHAASRTLPQRAADKLKPSPPAPRNEQHEQPTEDKSGRLSPDDQYNKLQNMQGKPPAHKIGPFGPTLPFGSGAAKQTKGTQLPQALDRALTAASFSDQPLLPSQPSLVPEDARITDFSSLARSIAEAVYQQNVNRASSVSFKITNVAYAKVPSNDPGICSNTNLRQIVRIIEQNPPVLEPTTKKLELLFSDGRVACTFDLNWPSTPGK
jgi:hypothetical protein